MNTLLQIPNFALFGETADLPDLVHCELIEDRAKSLNWSISVHQHSRLIQLFFIARGGGKMSLDGDVIKLTDNMCAIVPQNVPHGFDFDAQTKGWVVTIPTDTVNAFSGLVGSSQLVLHQKHVFAGAQNIQAAFSTLGSLYKDRSAGRQALIGGSLLTLLGHIGQTLGRSKDDLALKLGHPLLEKFRDLLAQNYAAHWPVSRYARELGISPTHLNRLCTAQSGMTANKWIESQIILHARRALAYTRADIAQIGYDLGFNDPAYFSRAFKRATGHSPKAFRAAYNQ